VIEQITQEEVKFVSQIGIVKKKGGKVRKILNAQSLNKYLKNTKFKMEGQNQVTEILKEGDYGITVDISKAYHHVPVNENMKSYLSFKYEGKCYRYLGTPFGVCTAPRVFSMIMHHCAKIVRTKWKVRCIQYLDDWLVVDQNRQRLQLIAPQILDFLRLLGWTINEQKCNLKPQRIFEFLGWKWNTTQLSVELPTEKRKCLLKVIKTWIGKATCGQTVPVRKLAMLAGRLSATRLQFKQASAYLSHIYAIQAKALLKKERWDATVRLSSWMLKDLLWWRTQIMENRYTNFARKSCQATIYTDASSWGWGAVLRWKDANQTKEVWRAGEWKEKEISWTSNHKELSAVERGMRQLWPVLEKNQLDSILLMSDNSAVVFNLNRRRACMSLLAPLRSLLNYIRFWNIQIIARHVPGIKNGKADKLSRISPGGDYEIKKNVLMAALKRADFKVDVDLFASKRNAKCGVFCSLGQTTRALACDAMTFPWTGMHPLLHPPIPMLLRVLRKAEQEEIEAAVVAPLWVGQVWSPILERMTLRKLDLGLSRRILVPGRKMRKVNAMLPPGKLGLYIIGKKMMQDSDSLKRGSR
jgi:hypothetical protein